MQGSNNIRTIKTPKFAKASAGETRDKKRLKDFKNKRRAQSKDKLNLAAWAG